MKRLLLIIFLVLFGWRLLQGFAALATPYSGEDLFFRYQNSQYFKGDKTDVILSDAEVNAVRGYQLAQQNANPVEMLPGHPLFGSWLMGLSGKFFGQPLWVNIASFVISVFLLYLIGRKLLSPILALVSVIIYLLEPMLVEQIQTTMLDIVLLTFCLASLYFYLHWLEKEQLSWLLLSQLVLGLGLTVKFWLAAFPLVVVLYLATITKDNFRKFLQHSFSLILLAFGFVLGHWQYFVHQFSLLGFFSYQRYLISWWAGSPQVPPGQVWDLIFANRWHTWWGQQEVIKVDSWWLLWPLAIILGLLAIMRMFKSRKITTGWVVLVLWIGFSLLIFNFSATYPRHLLLVLPSLYLLALSNFDQQKAPAR